MVYAIGVTCKEQNMPVRAVREDDLVWGFTRPHVVASVCGDPCTQCGPGVECVGANGELLPNIPMLIVAEATLEDWAKSNRRRGGPGTNPPGDYFYVVQTD